MHLGRRYSLRELLAWTSGEIVWVLAWSVLVTFLLVLTRWSFLVVPPTLLAVVGTAVAVVLAFKTWLNVPASLFVGWTFLILEKVGEASSNPFEGGANDVPISAIARRIEIELREMLGEKTDLAPFEPKAKVLL